MRRVLLVLVIAAALVCAGLPVSRISAAPTISNINVPVICNTSVLVNFRTSAASHAFIEYGLSTAYGSRTIDDTVRFYTEHAVQITGLSPNTTYHFRVNANDGGLSQSGDQTVTTLSSGASCPALPAQVDSRMPDMTGAVEKTVKTSGGDYTTSQFQTALNDAGTANEKRIITVDAGVTITGNFTVPANPDQQQIIVRSSLHAQLAEGRRVLPADSSSLFKIQTANADPVLNFAAASNHIRFIGAEITITSSAIADAPAGPEQAGLVQMQNNVAGSASNLSKFIGFDRVYVHGLVNKNTRRGIYLAGEDLFVIDSYLDDFHAIGGDAQAILATAVKRHKILNSTLIGSGENYMWGGTGIGVSGYVVSDLEFLRNHLYHPRQWKENGPDYAGHEWTEKNLFELKTSAKVLFSGNYLGGTTDQQGGFWPDAQSLAINLKLEQNSGGPTTCDLMEDIVFYKNFGKNLHAGTAIVGRTNDAQGCTNTPDRVRFISNVFELDAETWTPDPGCSSCSWNATGWSIGGTEDVQVIHNTVVNANPTQSGACNSVFGDGMIMLAGSAATPKWTGFIFQNNISDYRGCGVSASGFINNANNALNGHFTGYIFDHNGFLRTAGAAANFPPGNLFATSWTAQLLNFNGGREGDYRIANGSSWDNAASDGTDVGADIEGVEGAVAFTPTGTWPSTGTTICRWSTTPACQSQ